MAVGVGMPRKNFGFAPIKQKSDKLIFIFQEISMSVIALTVTEFSRGLSNFLNQVQYQGQTLDIQRGKKLVARVLPAGAADGFPIDRLDALLAKGPRLSTAERQAMAADVGAVRANLSTKDDPWDL